MSRVTSIKERRSLHHPISRWQIGMKMLIFGGGLIFLLWMWVSYSGLWNRWTHSFVGRCEKSQIALGVFIKKILVHGRKSMGQGDIMKALSIQLGDPMSRFDIDLAYTYLSRHPWVKSVYIRREWPDTLRVVLKERIPFALWQYHQHVVLVDDAGEILTHHIEPYKHLPMVIGKGAAEAASSLLSTLARYPFLQKEIISAVRIGERRWNLMCKNGQTIMLPEEGYDQSLKTLSELQKNIRILDSEKKIIDLRFYKKVVMR